MQHLLHFWWESVILPFVMFTVIIFGPVLVSLMICALASK